MQLEIRKHLFDILQATKNIEEFTRQMTYVDYGANRMVQAAVEREFEIIGEALSRIKKLDSSFLEHISEYQRIIGFRNVITHGYDAIDLELVWDAVKNHLTTLKEEVQELLNM
jgi:uncharacterized protein with HEPN domain